MSNELDPHTKTVFRGGLHKRTCHELLIALGFDQSPREMSVLSTVLVTALGALSRGAKADLVQFLSEADAQALADVRTLDEWQGKIGREMWSDLFGGPEGFTVSLDTEFGEAHEFRAESFPEARAKAAAWVREQEKGEKP